MGYCMSQQENGFHIEAKDFPEALKAIQGLHGSETIADASGEHFSWVPHDFYKINDLIKIMGKWRWELEIDPAGNAVGISFQGEKLGDDEILFKAIAPWVKKDSYIQMQGEDGSIWRWVFDGKTCVEKAAKI